MIRIGSWRLNGLKQKYVHCFQYNTFEHALQVETIAALASFRLHFLLSFIYCSQSSFNVFIETPVEGNDRKPTKLSRTATIQLDCVAADAAAATDATEDVTDDGSSSACG